MTDTEKMTLASFAPSYHLTWNGDNRKFILQVVLPNLKLSDYDKSIIEWAYTHGWEIASDGETGVKDAFLDGVIKDPAGVVHDAINRTIGHTTPDGHKWTIWQANAIYRRIHKALGMGFRRRWRRWLGLTISGIWGMVIPWGRWWK